MEEPESGLKINNDTTIYPVTLQNNMKSLGHFLFLVKRLGHLGNPFRCLLPLSYTPMASYELIEVQWDRLGRKETLS